MRELRSIIGYSDLIPSYSAAEARGRALLGATGKSALRRELSFFPLECEQSNQPAAKI